MKSSGKKADAKPSKADKSASPGKPARSAKYAKAAKAAKAEKAEKAEPRQQLKRASGELTTRRITLALNRAVNEALRVHKLLGQSVVTWRDGKVVWVAPEDIPVTVEAPVRRAPRRKR